MIQLYNENTLHEETKQQHPNIITDEVTRIFAMTHASKVCRTEHLLELDFNNIDGDKKD